MIKAVPLDQQPPLGGVALAAIGAQRSGVGIPVAIGAGGMGQAGKFQPEICGRFPAHGTWRSQRPGVCPSGERRLLVGEQGRRRQALVSWHSVHDFSAPEGGLPCTSSWQEVQA